MAYKKFYVDAECFWRNTAVPGTLCIEVVRKDVAVPIHILYIRKIGKEVVEIAMAFTNPSCRKMGYYKQALQCAANLWKNVKYITSPAVTDSGKKAFLAMGFKKDDVFGWIRNIEDWKE